MWLFDWFELRWLPKYTDEVTRSGFVFNLFL